MSLQVWIPFISDHHTQGLSQNTITPHNLSTYSAGKFGTAAQFNGSSTYVEGTVYTTATMTYMMWLYLDTLKGCHILDCRSSEAGYQPIYLNPSSGIQVGGSTSAFTYLPYTFTAGTWYHIAVTYSATKCQLFVNGAFIAETTNSKGTNINAIKPFYLGSRHTQTNWLHGRVNDFRIYDHTCSKKEIELIARGLFRHYKLDTINGTKICDCAGYGYHGTINGTLTLQANTARYSKSITTSDGSTNYITAPTMPSTCQTLSLWVKLNTSASQVLFADYGSNLLIAYWSNNNGFLVSPTNESGYTRAFFSAASITSGWNHLVLVKNSNASKQFYINGTEITAGSLQDYYKHDAGDLMIFRRNYNTNAAVVNSAISDVRVYVTALTATQIQWLYEEGAAVDSSQNIYAYELTDSSSATAPSVKKTGTLVGYSIQDGLNTASFGKLGVIKANSVIEY